MEFWCDRLGFAIAYRSPESRGVPEPIIFYAREKNAGAAYLKGPC